MHGLLGHCSYYVIPPCLPRLYPSFTSCFVVGLWLVHFLVNFLFQASHAHFSLLYLSRTLLANIPVVPTHFIASFFGLPQAIYYLFASFTFMSFLLNPLGVLDPITTSLLFNTTWAYWFLGQPIEFTNSFPGLSWLIYSLSTSYYSYELTTSFLKLSRPTYYLFISFHYCGHAGHQFYHSSLLGLALLLSLLTFFILLDFFYCWALCQKWTSTFIFL